MTTQTKPGVRISEDIRRQQGQAIISIAAPPAKPETLEFALRRYDCFANHLGPRGWQGTECWLTPEEAWYRGDELQFVLRADCTEHLENTTYRLTLRGRGLDEPVAIVFRWPSELTVETDNAEPRRVLGGAQVRAETETGRKPEVEVDPRPEPSAAPTTAEASSAAAPQPEPVDPVPLVASAAPIAGSVGAPSRRRIAWGLLLLSGLATSGGRAWWLVQTPTSAREPLSDIAPPSPFAAPNHVAVEPRVFQDIPAPTPLAATGDVGAESSTPAPAPPTPSASADDLEREREARFDREDLQREFERRLNR